jgi:uncharacterized protein (DUF58 family)
MKVASHNTGQFPILYCKGQSKENARVNAREFNSLLTPQAVARLESAVLRARHLVEGTLSGVHESPHKGASVEFLEHKRYTPGDEIKNLDWKLVARSDRLYVKQFEDETNVRAMLAVDASASMNYGPTPPTKIEFAQRAAAALTYLLLQQSDPVGLISESQAGRLYVSPSSAGAHFRAIASALDDVQATGPDSWLEHLMGVAGSFHKRSIFVLFTDLLGNRDQTVQALQLLRDRKHDVLLFHILHPWETEFPFERPTLFRGMENPSRRVLTDPGKVREEYLRKLKDLKAFYREKADALEIDYLQLNTRAPLETPLVRYLQRREERDNR